LPVARRWLCVSILAVSLASVTSCAVPGPLTWSPPKTSGAQFLQLTTARAWYDLDPNKDYVLRLPAGTYDRGGLIIEGGRNVTLIGGHIWVPETGATAIGQRRGLMLADQRGTVHVEGLQIDGPGLSEGIQMEQHYGATVRLQRIFVGRLRARDTQNFTDNHPDVVQTWAGPKRLLIDGLTGTTDYQGLFLAPTQLCQTEACRPSNWDLRNIDIRGTETARVLLWKDGDFPMAQRNIWADITSSRTEKASVWPGFSPWYGVTWGAPKQRMVDPAQVGEHYLPPPGGYQF
jgi:hypothetical protein